MQTNLACSLSLQTNLVYKPNLRSKATPQMKTKEAKAVADEATNEQVASAKDATAQAEAAVQIWPGLATATVALNFWKAQAAPPGRCELLLRAVS